MSSATPSSELNAAIVIARIQDGSYPRETILHIARGFLPLPQEDLITVVSFLATSSDAEIAQLTNHFLSKTIATYGRYHQVEPDTVLEIAFDRLQRSSRHGSGLAMRFPRILRIRTDKSPADIDTLATARALVRPHLGQQVEPRIV